MPVKLQDLMGERALLMDRLVREIALARGGSASLPLTAAAKRVLADEAEVVIEHWQETGRDFEGSRLDGAVETLVVRMNTLDSSIYRLVEGRSHLPL